MACKFSHLLLRCMAKKVRYPWDTNIDPSAYFSLLSSKGPQDKATLTRAAAGWKLNIEKACTSRKLRSNCISQEANTSLERTHTEQRSLVYSGLQDSDQRTSQKIFLPLARMQLGGKPEKSKTERSLKGGWWGQKKKENFVENWIEKLRVQANISHGKRLLLE